MDQWSNLSCMIIFEKVKKGKYLNIFFQFLCDFVANLYGRISLTMLECGDVLLSSRSDGQVDRTSASDSVGLGLIPESRQAKDFRKLAFTAYLLGVQH